MELLTADDFTRQGLERLFSAMGDLREQGWKGVASVIELATSRIIDVTLAAQQPHLSMPDIGPLVSGCRPQPNTALWVTAYDDSKSVENRPRATVYRVEVWPL